MKHQDTPNRARVQTSQLMTDRVARQRVLRRPFPGEGLGPVGLEIHETLGVLQGLFCVCVSRVC